ncbi:hypothetical protein, partial [Rhizobium sp. 1399]|uniref:hypothetical protein n=1 Tax=Rhizobium sp. 1399 TaxID=2817758 RepID=UPI00286C7C0A
AELPAHIAHAFALKQPGDKSKTFLHHRSLSPQHQHLPQKAKSVTHVSGTKRHLSLGSGIHNPYEKCFFSADGVIPVAYPDLNSANKVDFSSQNVIG